MKLTRIILIITVFSYTNCLANNPEGFNKWKSKFIKNALNENISQITIDKTMSKIQFLPKVIEYDRFQPEFAH